MMANQPIRTPNPLETTFGIYNPVLRVSRLSNATRALAVRYLSGEFGREMKAASWATDQLDSKYLTPNMQYALAIKAIAEKAPLRIFREEKLVGSATLLEATLHRTPGTKFPSTSHTTIGLESTLHLGYREIRKRINDRLVRGNLDANQLDLLNAMLICLDAAGLWHQRYVQALEERIAQAPIEDRTDFQTVLAAMKEVPENPPRNFHQAVQSLWMIWEFQRLCGNWSGIGRIDKMLGLYLKKDLAEETITLDDAREILAHFWIKGCEWIGANDGKPWGGDAQFYQNVILAGINAEGCDVTNEVTYLILDIVEELHISDFPIAVRCGSKTPERLFRRIAEVQRCGGGIVSIYNEDMVIRALKRFGYSLEEAAEFTNDGCWEVLIPGKTAFSYVPFDALQILQGVLGLNAGQCEFPNFLDFEALYAAYRNRMAETLADIHQEIDKRFTDGTPCPLLSIFVEDCIERGRGYHDRGSHFTVIAPHAGGLPDVINSLFVLKKFVFDEKQMPLSKFLTIVRSDWDGHDHLCLEILNRYDLYGNDNPETDDLAVRVFNDCVSLAGQVHDRNGVLRPPGISTFGREIVWRDQRTATPFGRRKGDILATNFAPTPGTDRKGPTAVIKSFCKMDYERLPNGVPLELKFLPSVLKDEAGLSALIALLKTFVRLNGWYLQLDVVDSELLRQAQQHPECYPNLVVRISGWSARFGTLSKEWQDMIIQRTQQAMST